jgi:prepilin-type N-terminal cleavage/methylation domain-containing protein
MKKERIIAFLLGKICTIGTKEVQIMKSETKKKSTKYEERRNKKRDSSFLQTSDFKLQKGFTLLEMLVAIMIFTLVIGSTVGFFISSIRSQSKVLATQKLLDETSYVIEYMSRTLRMAKKDTDGDCITAGSNYEITSTSGEISPSNCRVNPNKGFCIRFMNYHGECQEFFLSYTLKENIDRPDYSGPLELISPDYEVSYIIFNLMGKAGPPDSRQPRVTMLLKVRKAGGGPEITVQTTVSQRNLDL